jgi:hypothetical protein
VVLILALGALVVVTAAVLMVARVMETRRMMVSYEKRAVTLVALSDAALAESLAELALDADFTGVAQRPFSGGTIRSSVEIEPGGARRVTAVASFDGWTSTIRAEVAVHPTVRVVKFGRSRHPGG